MSEFIKGENAINEHYDNLDMITDKNITEEMDKFQNEYCDQTIDTVEISEC